MTAERALPASLHEFVGHVVRQVAHPLGAPRGEPADEAIRERSVDESVTTMLHDALAGEPTRLQHAATTLHGHALLLSAMFQNLDLLPAGDPASDRVALLVSSALHD